MKQIKDGFIYSFLSLLSFLFFGLHVQIAVAQDSMDKIDIVQEFKSLDNDINSALTRQVDVLSPNNFKFANAQFEAAKKNIEKENALKREIHRQISTARGYLSKANRTASLSRQEMEDVVVARQQAVAAGAPVYFSTDFQKADELLQSVSSDIEKNNTAKAEENRTTLKTSYSNLELRSIRHQHLAQAGLTILQAVKDGAKQYAPEKYVQVLRDYRATTDFIKDHRHDVQEIRARALAVNDGANQLLQTTHDVAEARRNSNEVLAGVEDVITTQQSSTAPKVEENKVKQIQKQFAANEAEVYQNGDTLVMRLRGLKFPVAKADLENSDLRLLGKVQRVIKDFKNSEVVIEGHTDNIGSKEINQKISMKRAQTIKDYLLSIDAISPDKIKIEGRGAETPLVSNQTPFGRALNRRVDILIKPGI